MTLLSGFSKNGLPIIFLCGLGAVFLIRNRRLLLVGLSIAILWTLVACAEKVRPEPSENVQNSMPKAEQGSSVETDSKSGSSSINHHLKKMNSSVENGGVSYTESYARTRINNKMEHLERYCSDKYDTCGFAKCDEREDVCRVLPEIKVRKDLATKSHGHDFNISFYDFSRVDAGVIDKEICGKIEDIFTPNDKAKHALILEPFYGTEPVDHFDVPMLFEALGADIMDKGIKWRNVPKDRLWEYSFDFAATAGVSKKIKGSIPIQYVIDPFYDEPIVEIKTNEKFVGEKVVQSLTREEFEAQWKPASDPYQVYQYAWLNGKKYALINKFSASSEKGHISYNPSFSPYLKLEKFSINPVLYRPHKFKNGQFPISIGGFGPNSLVHFIHAFHQDGSDKLILVQLVEHFSPDDRKYAALNVLQADMKNSIKDRMVSKIQCSVIMQEL